MGNGTQPTPPSPPCSGHPQDNARPASEDAILALIDRLFPSRTPHTPFGRGHDCAELHGPAGPLALSTDLFWQETHFRTAYFTPQEAGGKALAAAVSDLAAAGARPAGFSLGLLLPSGIGAKELEGYLEGMARKAEEYDMVLTGGDLARGDVIGFSLTVWGRPAGPGIPFLRRARPEPGDLLFLIGEAGLARVGLWALEHAGRKALQRWPAACAAHLAPRPLLAEGQAVARLAHAAYAQEDNGKARVSLMDLSDGLVRDIPRLLKGLGADLDVPPVRIPAETLAAAPHMDRSPEELFLLGGEDYALLGACPEDFLPRLLGAVPSALVLGRVRQEPGLCLGGRPLRLEGFDHFAFAGQEITPGAETDAAPPAFADAWREAAEQGIALCREAWQAGLMAGFNGNASLRVALPDDSDGPAAPGGRTGCLITRSGAAKGRLTRDDFALLALPDCRRIAGPAASTESAVHAAVYAACPDSRAVLHTHPPRLLALSLLLPPEKRLNLPLPEAAAYRALIAWAAFHPPGTAELGRAVGDAARTHAAVWMERHGLVVHGPDLAFALSLTEELEQLAGVQLAALESVA